jgi:hypothetical protein
VPFPCKPATSLPSLLISNKPIPKPALPITDILSPKPLLPITSKPSLQTSTSKPLLPIANKSLKPVVCKPIKEPQQPVPTSSPKSISQSSTMTNFKNVSLAFTVLRKLLHNKFSLGLTELDIKHLEANSTTKTAKILNSMPSTQVPNYSTQTLTDAKNATHEIASLLLEVKLKENRLNYLEHEKFLLLEMNQISNHLSIANLEFLESKRHILIDLASKGRRLRESIIPQLYDAFKIFIDL